VIYLNINPLENLNPIKIYYKVSNKRKLKLSLGTVIFPPLNIRSLVVGFCFHHYNKNIDKKFIKQLIRHNIGVIYVCDILPENYVISDKIVYVETGFEWFIHTIFKNPLIFNGVFHNNTKDAEKYANLFSKYTGFKIPIINKDSNLKLLKEFIKSNSKPDILIETYDGLGDILMSLPSAYTLYKKGYKVAYLVDQSKVDIFKNLDFIDKIYTNRNEIPIYKYNYITLSYRLSAYNLTFNQQHRIYSTAYLCNLQPNELLIDKPIIILDEKEKQYAIDTLKNCNNSVGICWSAVGTNRSYFRQHVQRLIVELNKLKFTPVLIGNNKEPYSSFIGSYLDLRGKTNLRQLFAIVWKLDYLITVDTGVLHVAGAFDTKTIALFGPIPAEWRCSTYKNCYPIQAPVPCSPCWDTQRVEPKNRHCVKYQLEGFCLYKIFPEMIIKKLLEICK